MGCVGGVGWGVWGVEGTLVGIWNAAIQLHIAVKEREGGGREERRERERERNPDMSHASTLGQNYGRVLR